MTNKPKVTIGIVSYKDIKYLQIAIPTLSGQSYKNHEIIICDNNPDQETTKWIKKNHPNIKVVSAGGNVGFGIAHNLMITKAIQNKSSYYLAFNSDIFASKDLLKNLIEAFSINQNQPKEKVAAINPKLLIWQNFPEDPNQLSQNIIDTTGIQASPRHHFQERGNKQIDQNRFKNSKDVWGISGACPLISIHALQEIQHSPTEFFDANFFMYKEDIDLSYRFRWNGYSIKYSPQAIAWHDRTGANPGNALHQILARRKRPNYIQEQSFLNHIQLLQKNWSNQYSLTIKILTLYEQIKIITYLLIFNRKVLKKIKSLPKTKKPKTSQKIHVKTMENYLSNKF